jgi:hypothetical protein
MIKAWCVVTLESLANHAIAENINNKMVAITAIEFPNNIIQQFKFPYKPKSELSKKIIILNSGLEGIEELVKTADYLTDTRNLIVHDKPYEYNELDEGNCEIYEFRNRGNQDQEHHKFSNLKEFYQKCDKIAQFLTQRIEITHMFSGNMNFCNLLNN